MRPYLTYPTFSPLAEDGLFMKAHVLNGAVTWTDAIDLSPDTLWLRGEIRWSGNGKHAPIYESDQTKFRLAATYPETHIAPRKHSVGEFVRSWTILPRVSKFVTHGRLKAMESCKGKNGDTWEIYKAGDGWRWRRTAPNGNIVGASTQGYSNKSDCIANAQRNGMDCTPS